MDGSHFDDLARSFATSVSRRRFIAGLAAGVVGLAGLRGASGRSCSATGDVCREDANCCSGLCGTKDRTGRRSCACPAGTTSCNGKCVNAKSAFQSDPANCGSCGVICPRTRCQIGVCSGGVCGLAPDPAAVGKACDDGNACTLNDVCRADGSCAGTPISCTARDQCHDVGTCDPATGRCSNPDKSNGAPCDDGNACTQADTCQGGVCVGGNPVVCHASDQCHEAGVCDAKTGTCSNPKKTNGFACDDGDGCTQSDTCQNGVCVGGNPVVCDQSDQCHEAGVCNPATGTCTYQPKADNTPCDDKDKCTIGDTCQAGVCTPGASKTCYASDQCHDAGVCNPATGECSDPAKPDGAKCDDGDACTRTDTCQSGVCVGTNPVICVAQDQCHEAGTCDSETGLCSNPVKANGVSCSDSNACTLTETCQEGVCTPETDVVCEPPTNPCQEAGICNHATGQCEYADKQNGSACVSGNKCQHDEICTDGVCGGGSAVTCDDNDGCTIDYCDPKVGCVHYPRICDDNNVCTTNSCSNGQCVFTPIVCDEIPCTITSCQHPTGCIHKAKKCPPPDQCHEAGVCNPTTGECEYVPKSNGSACDDGDLCTERSSCQDGVCVGGDPKVCAAGDQCHEDGVCDPATGECSNANQADGSACDDGNACTQTDTCQNGACVAGDPVVCTALDQCHDAGTCDPTTGQCTNPNKDNGSSCNDGNACNVNENCQNGVCVGGTKIDCSHLDSGECTRGVCDDGTCQAQVQFGRACEDGNPCTSGSTCQADGSCGGGSAQACFAISQCHDVGTCNPTTGQCSTPAKPNGTACNDGNPCTRTDTCQNGTCVGGNPVVCTSANQCQNAGVCDPFNGQCTTGSKKPDFTPCSADGNLCTNDYCADGFCYIGPVVTCPAPTNPCKDAGSCNSSTGQCTYPNKANGTQCTVNGQSGTCQSGECRSPLQGTCPGGANSCGQGGLVSCSTGGSAACGCFDSFDHGTVCTKIDAFNCSDCTHDQDCGAGYHCVRSGGLCLNCQEKVCDRPQCDGPVYRDRNMCVRACPSS